MFSNITSKGISKISAGVLVAIPSLALLQSAYFVTQFRHRHRDAPFPISPSKGLVYVKSQHKDSGKFEKGRIWSLNSFKRRFKNDRARTDQKKQPLRLLVIGDSLAAGVGSLRAISPLPESITKNLSKKLDKPVFWTCHGKHWIIYANHYSERLLFLTIHFFQVFQARPLLQSWNSLH